jgi:hypothetical protein
MDANSLLGRALRPLAICAELTRMPVARLRFDSALDPDFIRATHANFTRPHPRFKVFGNKTMGAALIDLAGLAGPGDYLRTVRQRGHAGPQSRKAAARGYRLQAIERNRHIDEIHAINTSLAVRQGRPMDRAYLERVDHYPTRGHYRYYGVFDAQGRLCAYCNLGYFGNFALLDQLLGFHNHDGVMYLLLKEIVCGLIAERRVDYVMYDMLLGARPGLREFKRRAGFTPYRVHYALA